MFKKLLTFLILPSLFLGCERREYVVTYYNVSGLIEQREEEIKRLIESDQQIREEMGYEGVVCDNSAIGELYMNSLLEETSILEIIKILSDLRIKDPLPGEVSIRLLQGQSLPSKYAAALFCLLEAKKANEAETSVGDFR